MRVNSVFQKHKKKSDAVNAGPYVSRIVFLLFSSFRVEDNYTIIVLVEQLFHEILNVFSRE